MTDRLFFYGTLMSGGPRGSILGDRGRGLIRPVGPASIADAELYVVGGAGVFPALVRQGGPRAVVHGELWEPVGGTPDERTAAFLEAVAIVDRIEGYRSGDPRSMYLRERVRPIDRPGVVAWTYVWNLDDGYFGPRIRSGSWREYAREATWVRRAAG